MVLPNANMLLRVLTRWRVGEKYILPNSVSHLWAGPYWVVVTVT